MERLSAEDALRLNVLLANEPLAVRIDESSLTVYGLSAQGESVVRLNPNCRDEIYLRRVRELISSQVLGSPGGYPVYLRRWTRMGQARDEHLAKLLLLGEPEAVVAVVYAPGLTEELARRAWWAMPTADNARIMLCREAVARSAIGRELAAYLIDYLPFEQEAQAMIDSIRLVLQPGLIDAATRDVLWARAANKPSYYVGFLWAQPDALPEPAAPHPLAATLDPVLAEAGEAAPLARLLRRLLSAPGQAFLEVLGRALERPGNQDVVVSLVECIHDYFHPLAPPELPRDPDALRVQAETRAAGAGAEAELVARLRAAEPGVASLLPALFLLAAVGEPLVAPVFARTDAIGSVMRRKLEPVLGPVQDAIRALLGQADEARARRGGPSGRRRARLSRRR